MTILAPGINNLGVAKKCQGPLAERAQSRDEKEGSLECAGRARDSGPMRDGALAACRTFVISSVSFWFLKLELKLKRCRAEDAILRLPPHSKQAASLFFLPCAPF